MQVSCHTQVNCVEPVQLHRQNADWRCFENGMALELLLQLGIWEDCASPWSIGSKVCETVLAPFFHGICSAVGAQLVGGGVGPVKLLAEPLQVTCFGVKDSWPHPSSPVVFHLVAEQVLLGDHSWEENLKRPGQQWKNLLHILLGQTGLGKSTYEHLSLTHTPLAQQAPAGACPNNSEAETASPLKINFEEVVWSLSSKSKPWPETQTWMESTSVKGAPSPWRSHGIGNWLGLLPWIISFRSGDIWGLESWLFQKQTNSSSVQDIFPSKSLSCRWRIHSCGSSKLTSALQQHADFFPLSSSSLP